MNYMPISQMTQAVDVTSSDLFLVSRNNGSSMKSYAVQAAALAEYSRTAVSSDFGSLSGDVQAVQAQSRQVSSCLFQALRGMYGAQTSSYSDLKTMMDMLSAKISTDFGFYDNINAVSSKINGLGSDIEFLSGRTDINAAAVSEVSVLANLNSSGVSALSDELDDAERRLDSHDSDIAGLAAGAQQAADEREEIRRGLGGAESRLDAAESRLASADYRISSVSSDLISCDFRVTELINTVDTQSGKLQNLIDSIGPVSNDISAAVHGHAAISGMISSVSGVVLADSGRISAIEAGDDLRDARIAVCENDVANKVWIKDPADPNLSAGARSNLKVVKIERTEYEQLIVDGTTMSGDTLYIISSDYVDVYGQRVRNVAEPELSGDAATKNYVDSVLPDSVMLSDYQVSTIVGVDEHDVEHRWQILVREIV